jgi:cell division protein FtsB
MARHIYIHLRQARDAQRPAAEQQKYDKLNQEAYTIALEVTKLDNEIDRKDGQGQPTRDLIKRRADLIGKVRAVRVKMAAIK